jgi:hypothetical protein
VLESSPGSRPRPWSSALGEAVGADVEAEVEADVEVEVEAEVEVEVTPAGTTPDRAWVPPARPKAAGTATTAAAERRRTVRRIGGSLFDRGLP